MSVSPHPSDPSELAADLRALISKLKRRLREQADVGELTPSQTSVLLRLEREGQATASHLARAEGMRPQSMATVIGALETAGLVSGMPDPADGRQTLLSLTEACRRKVQEGRAARQDWLSRALRERLSLNDLEVVARAVGLLQGVVDD